MKTTENLLKEIGVAILLTIVIAIAIHSYSEYKKAKDELRQLKENEITNIKIY